jgi:hypothetical protein
MRFLKTYGACCLALLAIAPAAAQAQHNEIEADAVWYFPSNIELESLNTTLELHDTFGFGLRYGYRWSPPFGTGFSWTHVDLDAGQSDANRIGCSTCDLDVNFYDFSAEWYPGGHDWSLYAGLGWASGDFDVNIPGDSNDRSVSDDAFTWHLGTAWTWHVGTNFYIRPDAKLRFIELDQSGRGKYDSEDPEFKVGLGWRF